MGKKRCYNCKYAGQPFKVVGKTHVHCENRTLYPEKDIMEGKISAWDTLMEFSWKCPQFEPKES
jgi:hypothetical protein